VTTSLSGARLGSQTPRVRSVPAYEKTYGAEVVDFMAQIGRPLDPWQAAITMDAFGVRPDGLWSAFELLLLLARQNGKGGATEALELGGLFLFREPLILHSAHQFKTSTAAFRRQQEIIDGSDWLRSRVKMISRSKGDESVELTRQAGGGRLQFVARTDGSGRGLTGSKTVFDEAAWLTVGQYAAQTPTLATIPNPQIVYTTTPPDEDIGPVPEDAMLPSVRRRAAAGDERTALYEWSPAKGFDRTDRDVWYDCNPALGIRISEWFLAKQLAAFTEAGRPEKFDTEHLGRWDDDEASLWQTIREADWLAAADVADAPVLPVAFGLEVDWDRRWAAIGVAWRRPDGLRQVELTADNDDVVDVRPGVGWLVARAKQLLARWQPSVLVVPTGPASSLLEDFASAGVAVVEANTTAQAASYGVFYDGVAGQDAAARDVRHGSQPDLNAAVAGVVARQLGDAKVWDRKVSPRFSPLGAVSSALYGLSLVPAAVGPPNLW
jgi:hypothetical protein